jgi:hypothetical protein
VAEELVESVAQPFPAFDPVREVVIADLDSPRLEFIEERLLGA